MGKKSQRSKAQKKARKIEDLPVRHKGKNIKGGSRENPTESITFAFQKVKVGY
jgi:hypothetical protein